MNLNETNASTSTVSWYEKALVMDVMAAFWGIDSEASSFRRLGSHIDVSFSRARTECWPEHIRQ